MNSGVGLPPLPEAPVEAPPEPLAAAVRLSVAVRWPRARVPQFVTQRHIAYGADDSTHNCYISIHSSGFYSLSL